MSAAFDTARAHFQQGVAAFEAGDAAAAEAHLLASLQHLPGRPSTLVNLAAARLALGRPAEALPPLDEALAASAAQPDAWCHRASACSEIGRDTEALDNLARAQALAPLPPAARCLQATLLNRQGRHAKALAVLQALLAEHPALADAELLRGQTLQALGRPDEALAAYRAATAADPALPDAWLHQGVLLAEAGQAEAARAALQRAREAGGDAALLDYLSAPLAGSATPPVAPAVYLRLLFDPYAESFDEHLVQQLHYRGHEAVVAAAKAAAPAGRPTPLRALDLGCGSGLCGPLLRPWVQRLEGVDLSPTMVRLARNRACYDTVHEAELLQHLRAQPAASADVIVAADVFIYLGELGPVFAEVARVLAPGGCFAFSVEQATESETVLPGVAFVLRRSLRYAHTEAGLRATAAAQGLQVRSAEAVVLRQEQQQPVPGCVMVLQPHA
ncbi:methyltransferase domain-containing protein [Rubrivivax rivuli]|uniref:Methyltransferase domain-containing protein n=1 Tax=Rubrivivax rivuli TaxID=1862385 RepID=A0A437RSB8_9BURK|nr:tetratricopeptide repeat protein [Rubrivivax rivuli]RVU49656.1 methyltransferase domain-containing protein [Rubrivivax rivuli]